MPEAGNDTSVGSAKRRLDPVDECRYPNHAGYGGAEAECMHCNCFTVEEIRAWLSRGAPGYGSY